MPILHNWHLSQSVAIFASLNMYHSRAGKHVRLDCSEVVEKHLPKLTCLHPYSLQNICAVT